MTKDNYPNIAPQEFYDPVLCPIRNVLSVIVGKWSLIVISHLRFGSHRFSELKRGIPDVSQRMLTQTLRTLEREGIVLRTVTQTIPPRVDYELTSLGHSFIKPLEGISQWAIEKRELIEKSRQSFDEA